VYKDLAFTATTSDGRTAIKLRTGPGGVVPAVGYRDRWEYANEVVAARLHESMLQMQQIRHGVHAVVPGAALALLTWRELELRVCGDAQLNVELLKKHTVYNPVSYSHSTPVVGNFWSIIESFSEEDRARFLQFVWARSRLPADMSDDPSEDSYRMQINILEDGLDQLPSSQTCFFILKLPKYPTVEVSARLVKFRSVFIYSCWYAACL